MQRLIQHLHGRWLALGAGLAVLILVAGLALALRDDAEAPASAGFTTAPAFELPALDEETSPGAIALADHQDGPLFVYFWASWCLPCEREAPMIQRLWPEYEARGYHFIGVNIWDVRSDAVAFARRHQLSFPIASDPEGRAAIDFGVTGLPDSYFLAPGGQFQRRYIGELREADFRAMLDALMETS